MKKLFTSLIFLLIIFYNTLFASEINSTSIISSFSQSDIDKIKIPVIIFIGVIIFCFFQYLSVKMEEKKISKMTQKEKTRYYKEDRIVKKLGLFAIIVFIIVYLLRDW